LETTKILLAGGEESSTFAVALETVFRHAVFFCCRKLLLRKRRSIGKGFHGVCET